MMCCHSCSKPRYIWLELHSRHGTSDPILKLKAVSATWLHSKRYLCLSLVLILSEVSSISFTRDDVFSLKFTHIVLRSVQFASALSSFIFFLNTPFIMSM